MARAATAIVCAQLSGNELLDLGIYPSELKCSLTALQMNESTSGVGRTFVAFPTVRRREGEPPSYFLLI
jgi:hypothetical protein